MSIISSVNNIKPLINKGFYYNIALKLIKMEKVEKISLFKIVENNVNIIIFDISSIKRILIEIK